MPMTQYGPTYGFSDGKNGFVPSHQGTSAAYLQSWLVQCSLVLELAVVPFFQCPFPRMMILSCMVLFCQFKTTAASIPLNPLAALDMELMRTVPRNYMVLETVMLATVMLPLLPLASMFQNIRKNQQVLFS